MSINVTENAVKEIKRVMQEQNIPEESTALNVGVNGGGCAGFSYSLGFKEINSVDVLNETVFDYNGFKVIVNNKALALIEGTTIDFYSGLEKRGFTFNNPLATKGCGCGNSFGNS